MKKNIMLIAIMAILVSFSSCSKDDDGGSSSNPLVGKKFYCNEGSYYLVLDFFSDERFKIYEADMNFIQTSTDWSGFYDYDPSTGIIDYRTTIFFKTYGFSVETRKLLTGKYDGNKVTASYVYHLSSDKWSEQEYYLRFYPR